MLLRTVIFSFLLVVVCLPATALSAKSIPRRDLVKLFDLAYNINVARIALNKGKSCEKIMIYHDVYLPATAKRFCEWVKHNVEPNEFVFSPPLDDPTFVEIVKLIDSDIAEKYKGLEATSYRARSEYNARGYIALLYIFHTSLRRKSCPIVEVNRFIDCNHNFENEVEKICNLVKDHQIDPLNPLSNLFVIDFLFKVNQFCRMEERREGLPW